MKKHVSLLLFVTLCLSILVNPLPVVQASSHSNTLASFIGLNKNTLVDLIQDLDFYSSRGIDIVMPLPQFAGSSKDSSSPFTLGYKARWGYKGAGDRNQAFTGFQGHLSLTFSYDGITIDPFKSKSIKAAIEKNASPLLTISPVHEFYFKVFQLLWSESQKSDNDIGAVSEQIATLLARLRLTEGAQSARIQGILILGNQQQPGFDTFFSQAPTHITSNILTASKKLFSAIGLFAASSADKEKQAYLQQLLDQINYFDEKDITLNMPKGGTISLPFSYAGSGLSDQPFTGTTMLINIPATQEDGVTKIPAMKWALVLRAEHECFIKTLLLLLHNRKESLPGYRISEEIGTLLNRLAVTPLEHRSPSALQSLLALICHYHQQIISHDFSAPPVQILDTPTFCMHLLAIGYRGYTMSVDHSRNQTKGLHSQAIADFVALQCAYALRQYQGFVALQNLCYQQQPLRGLEQKGVHLNWGLFFKTLLSSEHALEIEDKPLQHIAQ